MVVVVVVVVVAVVVAPAGAGCRPFGLQLVIVAYVAGRCHL